MRAVRTILSPLGGTLRVGDGADAAPFAQVGGLMYGYGIAMGQIIYRSGPSRMGAYRDVCGAAFWMPPWRHQALFGKVIAT